MSLTIYIIKSLRGLKSERIQVRLYFALTKQPLDFFCSPVILRKIQYLLLPGSTVYFPENQSIPTLILNPLNPTMQKIRILLASFSILLITGVSSAQNVTLPARIKSQCDAIPQEQKLKIAVAKFVKTNNEIPDKYNDVFSSVLFNTLYQSNCFRVYSMPDPATMAFGMDSSQMNHATDAQFLITGEMTQFNTS